jgi:hypothetical protein
MKHNLVTTAAAFAATVVLEAAVPATPALAADGNVWTCREFGAPTREPLGDREGHMLWQSEWNCLVQSGPLVGGVATGNIAYEFDGPKAKMLTFQLVVRKPGALAVVKGTEGALTMLMTDGKVTGATSTGRYDYVLASGDWASLMGKSETYLTKSTAPGEFSCESTYQ